MRNENSRASTGIVDRLREVMLNFSDVKLAYLFGSYAEGREMPASDLDMAVLTGEKRIIPYLTAEISKALNFPEEKISILNIEEAAPSVRLRILSRGVKILDRGAYEEELRKELGFETFKYSKL